MAKNDDVDLDKMIENLQQQYVKAKPQLSDQKRTKEKKLLDQIEQSIKTPKQLNKSDQAQIDELMSKMVDCDAKKGQRCYRKDQMCVPVKMTANNQICKTFLSQY